MSDGASSLWDHATREDAHAAQVIGTAKLLAPFAAAVAASFLIAALQIGQPTTLDYIAAWMMSPVMLLTVGIVSLKKATSSPKYLFSAGCSSQDRADAGEEFLRNVRSNIRRASWVHWVTVLQVVLSCAVSTLAVIEIIRWLNLHPPTS